MRNAGTRRQRKKEGALAAKGKLRARIHINWKAAKRTLRLCGRRLDKLRVRKAFRLMIDRAFWTLRHILLKAHGPHGRKPPIKDCEKCHQPQAQPLLS